MHCHYLRYDFWYFRNPQSIFIIRSILIFLIFLKINIKYNPLINQVAAVTFGIYLIHDNDILRPFVWNGLFHVAKFYTSDHLAFHAIITALAVFTICGLVDFIRMKILDQPLFNWLSPRIDKLEIYSKGKIDRLCNYIIKKF